MGIKKLFSPIFEMPRWIGLAQLKYFAQNIKAMAVNLFVPPEPGHIQNAEQFAEEVQRLHLTEDVITQRKVEFSRLTKIFIVAAILLFFYTIYLFIHSPWRYGLLSFLATLFLLTQAFRYNFWLFQLNKRKLGCSFNEWLHEGLLGNKK